MTTTLIKVLSKGEGSQLLAMALRDTHTPIISVIAVSMLLLDCEKNLHPGVKLKMPDYP
jgi:hypothetical protein